MRWIGVLAMVAALGLVATGCGGSTSSSDAAATEATATEAFTEQTTTEETSTDDMSTDEDTTSTEETTTDGGGALGALSGECQDLVDAGQAFGAALSSAAANGANNDLGATADAYQAFADKAPAELKDDFKALASVIDEYAGAIKDLDLKAGEQPSAAQIAKLVAISQSFNSTKVQKASAAIAAWTTKNCGQDR